MLAFFEWCEGTMIGVAVRESLWLFPIVEAVHLLGLSLLGGVLLVVDLRMLGLGLKSQSIAELARQTRPWLVASVLVMIATGVPLFLSEAVKCYYNTAFWVKITTLPAALLYTFLIRQRIAADPSLVTSARSRLAAVASLAVWFTVAAAGRWIGFS